MSGFLLHLIPPLLNTTFKNRGFSCSRILLEWEKIVGEEFSNHCFPDRVHFPKGQKKQGTLYLILDPKSAFRFEYIKDLIIERINTYFGYNAISYIKVFQKPVNKTKPPDIKCQKKTQNTLSNFNFSPISHENLQKALEKYSTSLARSLDKESTVNNN